MLRPPYPPGENIFARGLGVAIVWIGLVMGLSALGLGYVYWRAGEQSWQTMVFTTLTLSQMGLALALRSEHDSLFRIGLRSNLYLVAAVSLSTLLQLAVVYVPFFQEFFRTVALSPRDLLISLGVASLAFWAVEINKQVRLLRQPK
jgi:Ca2+-transporting ATPase